ncbi:MAG: thymidine phosphorylase [Candidatus Hodarchaeales archaeon]
MKPKLIHSNKSQVIVFSIDDIPLEFDSTRYSSSITNGLKERIFCNEILILDQIPSGHVGLPLNVFQRLKLDLKEPQAVICRLELREIPDSYRLIKKRMKFPEFRFNQEEINLIVNDTVSGRLSNLEKTAFVMSQHFQEFSMDEVEYFTKAMAYSGETIDFDEVTYDKHSLGGVPGNKVTLLIVPIIASQDLLIPKTSSRAITSPSGTADTMEALGCRISFNASEIIEMSSKSRGVIVWGGALNLAPADNILIKDVEFPLGIDPQSMFMTSIMAKKKALGADFLVLDVPTGKGAKVLTVDEAQKLSRSFGELGQRLDIQVECGITFASAPVGHFVGPALEAREALSALIDPKNASTSLVEKSTALAGMILEQAGKALKGQGQNMAKEILNSGKAYTKMKEIIEVQEGDPNIRPEEIPIGEYFTDFKAPASGWPADINNSAINQIAKAAGAPTEKGSGIHFLIKKESVKAGDTIFRVYSHSSARISKVESLFPVLNPVTIEGMLLGRI